MRAVRFSGHALELVELPDPIPGPGQVLLRVTGAGLCHSDLTVMARPAEAHPFPLPIVLGHEAAGVVVDLGEGVGRVAVGDQVASYGPRGCGICPSCVRGAENYCPHSRRLGIFPPGLGADGALAELMLVDERQLAPADGLEPLQTAALTDAGLTSYHAVSRLRLGADRTVVVIGIGGLGHCALQVLRATTTARLIAVDVTKEKLELAQACGADECYLAGDELVDQLRETTRGLGVDAVLDFVGSDATVRTAAEVIGVNGNISLVGVGTGRLPVGIHALPLGVTVDLPFWGRRQDLADVLALARRGDLKVHVEEFTLAQAPTAYEKLRAGAVLGRAVVNPTVAE